MDCVGLLAALPPATVQRILGGRAGRFAADRARGIDPRPVAPRALPTSTSVSHTFPRQKTLDGAEVRAALLHPVGRLGLLLRRRGQVARSLALTLKFAGGPSWEKTRRLPEASAHDDDLRATAYRLIDAAGLHGAASPASFSGARTWSAPIRSPSRSASIAPARTSWSPSTSVPSTTMRPSTKRCAPARMPLTKTNDLRFRKGVVTAR